MSRTPTVVMVVSILGIIYSALGVLGTPCGVAMLFVNFGVPNPAMDALRNDAAYMAFALVFGTIGFLLALLLLSSSIASLKLVRWGRSGMLTYAWLHVVQTVVATAVNLVYVLPRTEAAMAAGPGAGGPAGAAAAKIGSVAGIAGAIFGVVLAVGVAGVIIYVFTRPKVVDAFNGIFPADPTDFPDGYGQQRTDGMQS